MIFASNSKTILILLVLIDQNIFTLLPISFLSRSVSASTNISVKKNGIITVA